MEVLFNDTTPIYTVGHSNRSAAAFHALLAEHSIELVVDVRRYPTSKRHPQFRRDRLEAVLKENRIRYVHEGDLGGHREPLVDSDNEGITEPAFRGYADHMQTQLFRDAIERLAQYARSRTVAVMCAEKHVETCHRRLLSDALLARGARIVHVLAAGAVAEHSLSDRARVRRGGTVDYPAPPTRQLELFAS